MGSILYCYDFLRLPTRPLCLLLAFRSLATPTAAHRLPLVATRLSFLPNHHSKATFAMWYKGYEEKIREVVQSAGADGRRTNIFH